VTYPKRIRVICVDDHPLVRKGIEAMVRSQPDLDLVAAAASGEEALGLVDLHQPDVVLMDLQLPGLSGLEAIRSLRASHPSTRVIVVTLYEGDEDIASALRAGASTYLLKDIECDELADVIRRVHAGERMPLPVEVQRHLEEHDAEPPLTPRELDVLRSMGAGLTNRQISTDLGIADDTTKMHIRNVFAKLRVGNRSAAILTAARRGIIRIPK
jgi:DNA-binding NarL/FixJ family response regulator